MKSHTGVQNALVLSSDTDGALAPIGGIAQPDRIASAGRAFDTGALQRSGQRFVDITGAVSGACRVKAGLKALCQRGFCALQIIRGCALKKWSGKTVRDSGGNSPKSRKTLPRRF